MGCMLVLFINRNSYIGFRLVPKTVTLHGLMAVIMHFYTDLLAFKGNHIKLVKARPVGTVYNRILVQGF